VPRWTFGIELLDEGIEPGLLLENVHARRAGCLNFQREMHAFVPAVLFGATWFGVLDGNAESEPPHRELREIEEKIPDLGKATVPFRQFSQFVELLSQSLTPSA
jgi:hypothetical protein